MPINIGETMTGRAFLSPEREGFAGEGYRYTFRQVNNRVNQFACFLAEQKTGRGDRMAILCKNNQHFATAFYAAAKTGVVTVPLSWRLTASELSYILADCGASILLYDCEFSQLVEQLKQVPAIRNLVRVGGSGAGIEFEEALAGRRTEEPETTAGGEDPAIIMYTSGTTGRPKGAILSHNNLYQASIGLTYTLDWRLGDRFLSVAPLFHIGGLAPIIANVHKGCTTIFLPNFDPVEVWRLIAAEKINFMMSVPLMIAVMIRVPEASTTDLSSLRFIICGGAPVPESLIKTYYEKGIKVYQVYGISEYTGAVSFWTHEMGLEKCNSMGKPVFHGSVKIIDWHTGRELPAGEVGEIVCGGRQVFKGYWNNPGATGSVLKDGWYHSGDLGKKDEDGFIYVVDRLKDMIISGGENIYPAELEMVIGRHPAVAEVAVVGVPDSKWGEVPLAYVVKKPGVDLTDAEIFALCRENLAGYKCVKAVRIVDALPRNAVGKILKKELRERAR
ncbi:long-chain-fatty-acid--CoA ligase [Desulfotomaculum copahuensis]|nr:long-chain-fatty-acid--CoA ligase [Desulfotomaculum copahuensis]